MQGNYEQLKAAIAAVIKTNGNNEITGALMQQVLQSIVSQIGQNGTFAGIATPATNPGTPDQNVFYLASESGVYPNFAGYTLEAGHIAVFANDSGAWTASSIEVGSSVIGGFVALDSIADLPESPSDPHIGYIIGTHLYVYVGTGGDTADGKYQDCGEFRGPAGERGEPGADGHDGVSLGEVAIVNNLTEGGSNKVLSAEMGKVIMYGADEMVDVDYEITQNGKYMSGTIGQASTEASNANLGYVKIPVNAGDVFLVNSKGMSTYAPSYVITDSNLIVLNNCTNDVTNIPHLIEIEQSGFLIVNNLFNQYATPKITKVFPKNGEYNIEANGKFISCATVGGTATLQNNVNYSCALVPVFAGQKVTIYTKGEGNNRGWALLDGLNKVLSNSVANLDARSTPAILDIESTCRLVINNKPADYTNARYIIEGGGGGEPTPNLTDHEERIAALESGTATNELQILCVGNSFTGDTLEYMQSFLTDLGIDGVTIYKAQIGGSTLQRWWDCYINDTTLTPYKITGYNIPNIGTTLKELFAHDWDYIMFQAYTGDALAQYNPYICDLATHARKLCTNVSVKIALNLPWSSSANYSSSSVPKGVDGFNAIASACSQAVDYFGNTIDVVIPTGTALQNARGTTLTNEADLTRDYHHAAGGVAKYIITATFFEALIKPFTKISAFASTLDISTTASSSDLGAKSVTASNRSLCLTCAEYAIANPFNISTVIE